MFAIFLTLALDFLGVGIILPIATPLLLSENSAFFSSGTSFEQKTLLLGLLLAAFPLSGFFGAPIIGALSDKVGRKRALLITLLVTLFSYLIFVVGIISSNLYLLFLSRILGGFAGGNIPICVSALADISKSSEKARNFGLIGVFSFGFGSILGPIIGGKLADPALLSWFSYTTPFFFATFLTLINLLAVSFYFRETIKVKVTQKFDILSGARDTVKACTSKRLRRIFLISFLITFGFNIFIQYFQIFLVSKFNFNPSQIGTLLGYIGIWMVVSQGLIIRFLPKRLSGKWMISLSLLIVGFSFPLLIFPNDPGAFWLILPIISIFQGLAWPLVAAVLSNLAGDSQGEVLGINQSLTYLAQGLPPIIAVVVASINPSIPILLAAGVSLLAFAISKVAFEPEAVLKLRETDV